MSTEMQTKVQASPAQNFTPVQTGLLQRKSALCNTPGLVEDSGRDKEKQTLQRSSADQAGTTTVPPIVHEVLRSQGQPLDPAIRTFMEPRFGHDFSRVRVHTDSKAAESARAVNAPAYTVGRNVAFDAGQYTPQTPTGQSLDVATRAHREPHFGHDFSRVRVHTDVPKTIQTKLIVGQPNDRYEQEADRVADQVMRMPELRLQRQAESDEEEEKKLQTKPLAAQITPLVQRQIEPEEEKEEPIRAKQTSGQTPQVSPILQNRIHSLRGGGQPLSQSLSNFFEPRFGHDFTRVRIHADSEAAETAQTLKARAFTVGADIVFGRGEYAPKSTVGKRLMAHELTHVLQQEDRSGTLSEILIQRHNLEGGCETPDTCGRLRRTLLELVGGVQRSNVQSWVNAIGPIQEFINGLDAEETLSLRTMLGEIGRNPDTDLQREFGEHLWPLWRSRIIAMLRTRTAAARAESATEEVELEEEEAQAETGSRFLELPGEPLRGTSQPTQLRQVRSGEITIRINDVSGNWQIVGIERDWREVVTLRVRNLRTRQVHGWSLQDWHVQRSITHVRQSTEIMADIAEAEVRILYELALPVWIRVPGEMAWMAFVCHQHREELERLVRDIGQLNPTLEWLQQNAPMSMQAFLVRRFALRVGQGMPQVMNPVQIGREIGRTLRNIRTLIRVIIAITRAARGSVAGVSSSILAFLGHGGRVLGSEALANGIAIIQNFRGLMRGISGLQIVGSTIPAEAQGRIADWLRSEGITLENRQIDQIIRENSSEETGQRMIQVLDALRNFVELSTALADEIDFQRPSPPTRSE